jgi:hypothetical protein
MNLLEKALLSVLATSTLKVAARQALAVIDKTESLVFGPEVAIHSEVSLVSTKELAKIYDLRRRMNYFENSKVSGLDETIEIFEKTDRDVRHLYAYAENTLISVWISESNQVCGVLLIQNS